MSISTLTLPSVVGQVLSVVDGVLAALRLRFAPFGRFVPPSIVASRQRKACPIFSRAALLPASYQKGSHLSGSYPFLRKRAPWETVISRITSCTMTLFSRFEALRYRVACRSTTSLNIWLPLCSEHTFPFPQSTSQLSGIKGFFIIIANLENRSREICGRAIKNVLVLVMPNFQRPSRCYPYPRQFKFDVPIWVWKCDSIIVI